MHRVAATPGGWNPQGEGVVFIEQSPATIVVLTAADTEIQTIAQAISTLPPSFPTLRVVNLLHLQQQLTIDTYAETVLESAQVIILRLLGGRAYWSYGLEVVRETAERTGATLIVMPGDDRPDPDLLSHSTVPLAIVNQLWRYFIESGVTNIGHALQFLTDTCLGTNYHPPEPQPIPQVGLYHWQETRGNSEKISSSFTPHPSSLPKAGILFYRAHYLSGNTAPIDALCQALAKRRLEPVPIFVSSLRDPDVQAEVLSYLQPKDKMGIQVLLNTTSFAIAQFEGNGAGKIYSAGSSAPPLWQQLNVPVLQVILSGGTVEQWQTQFQGLSPRDVAMNVALPEVDGRIISRAISFKATQTRHPDLETDVVSYEPVLDRVAFVANLATNWVKLRRTPVSDRRVALILANYPTRDGRLANGVGLDTPASCVEILKALQAAGYQVENIPQTGDELIQRLTATVTNDPEGQELRPVQQSVSLTDYQQYFKTLPQAVRQGVSQRWGDAERDGWGEGGMGREDNALSTPPHPHTPTPLHPHIPIAGIQLGNIFVGIQPARGYDIDPSLNYHAPDLEPTHTYLAFYHWVRQHFGSHAIVHVGKHGNLEWLPGKSLVLSETCYPEVALGALPHLYPFIVNDPGEGSQAKRRSQAVILDHLTPPMTRAELYGSLHQLEGLIDEYYEAQSLDPSRLEVIRDRILQLLQQEDLHQELIIQNSKLKTQNSAKQRNDDLDLTALDTYLCELKEAQIRDGLHIFGQCPQGEQLRDLIVAIARHPGQGRMGLTRALAQDLGFAFDPLTANLGEPFAIVPTQHNTALSFRTSFDSCRTIGDGVEALEQVAADLVASLMVSTSRSPLPIGEATQQELTWIATQLLPTLQQTQQEITNLLHGLNGGYVPSGASGAPTRGRPDVLPTGRNFYSVDVRSLPTESAWSVGRKAAEALIERYTQEHGEYPKTLGLSVWGTSTMRTGGDDIAEALALLGVQPVWEGASRRVIDFEILPLSVLGRPRVDVTLRISGFFRDAFANLIDLFNQAVTAVAALDEPIEQNPLAAQVQQDRQFWQTEGLTPEQSEQRSHYRVFGSKPGAYGAGLQGLIESQNWTDDRDLARTYINWSSYAYTGWGEGHAAPEAFEQRLQQLQIVLHNQDNREHDLLDSDDYYQFQGGLTVAVRSVQGKNPQTYFGDHSLPENPKVRSLQEEIARVYRSRVVNPKWIAGVMRHGYKGAFEMAATVDYLFAYDATTNCVADYMYEGITNAYLLDSSVQAFVQQHNPWALRDMAERLLEANQRGLWQTTKTDLIDQLRAIVHEAEGTIEHRSLNL